LSFSGIDRCFIMQPMEHTIPDMLEQASHAFGDKGYLYERTDSGWHGYSFSQTRQLARAFASVLVEHSFGGPVALLSEGRPFWVIAEIGALISGTFSVPLSIKLSAEEISYRIEHSQANVLICSRLSRDKAILALTKCSTKPKVIYFDELSETEKFQQELGLTLNIDLFLWDELISEGSGLIDISEKLAKLEKIEQDIKPTDTATVCYTSGTTGNPKGIMLSHGNYFANVSDALGRFPIPYNLRMFVILPVDHSYAHTIALYAPLMRQIALYFVDGRNGTAGMIRSIQPNMQEVKPDILLTVPSLLENFIQKIHRGVKAKGPFVQKIFNAGLKARIFMNGTVWDCPAWYKRFLPWFSATLAEILVFRTVRSNFGNLGLCINGGAYLDIKVQEFFKAIGIPVYQGYGLTEAGPVVSTNSIPNHKIGSAGKVLPHVPCRIVNDTFKDVLPGEKGQILLKGDAIMKGYLHNEAETTAAFYDGWLKTGDLGWIDKDGFLYVTGREKALLITSDGEKYSPEEIENAIVQSSRFIGQCMLWCDHVNYVSALITLRDEEIKSAIERSEGKNSSELLALIEIDFKAWTTDSSYKSVFPNQWRPACFAIVDSPFSEKDGTINSTMKLVRHKVMELHGSLVEYQYTHEGSRSVNPQNVKTLEGLFFK